MAETTIPPSASAIKTTSAGSAGNAPTAPVTPAPPPSLLLTEVPVQQAPPALTQPNVPTQVQGQVVSTNPQAQEVVIQTPSGEIKLQSAATFPPNTDVSVEIYTERSQTLANIKVLQQETVQTQELKNILPPPALQEGKTVTALLLQEQLAQAVGKGADTAALPDKPNIIRQLLSAYLPSSLTRPNMPAATVPVTPDILDNNLLQIMRAQLHAKATQQTLLPSPPPAMPAAGSSVPSMPSTLNSLLSSIENIVPQSSSSFATLFARLMPESQTASPLPQNMYNLNILKILPPGTPPEQAAAALQKFGGTPVQAQVETLTSTGQPILKTPDSHFVLRTPATVPVGSVILFEAIPATPEQILSGILSAKGFDPLIQNTWPALQDALQILSSVASPALQAFKNTLPAPTSHFTPSTLFFLAALRLGVVDNWLGNNTLNALRQAGKKDLAERLGSDFSKLSQQSKEVMADDWRSISIPFRHDDQISQMQFYVRQHYDQNNKEKEDGVKPATRFILNLHLSRMGDMQLDGYVQKKTFDIILRSQEKLPFEMRQELMKRFAQGLEQVSMQGSISFQTQQQSWVTVEPPSSPKGVVT